MIYLFRKTVFNCHQATLLSLKRDEGRITLPERVKLSYHLLYCEVCRSFIKQSHEIDVIGKKLKNLPNESPKYSLSSDAQERIQHEIDLLNP